MDVYVLVITQLKETLWKYRRQLNVMTELHNPFWIYNVKFSVVYKTRRVPVSCRLS